MIVTDTLAARAEVDLRRADEPGLEDFMFQELSRHVIANAENLAYFIGEGSTFMQRGKVRAGTFTVPFVVYWCPDPTLGVEFRGGQNDGKVLPLHREADGRPPEQYRLPPEFSPPTLADYSSALLPVVSMSNRIGIDSVFDRWVYQSTN